MKSALENAAISKQYQAIPHAAYEQTREAEDTALAIHTANHHARPTSNSHRVFGGVDVNQRQAAIAAKLQRELDWFLASK